MEQLHKWSLKCIWPDGDVVGDTYGVTSIELALSFCLYINSYLPVKRVKADGTEGLVPVMNDSDLEIYAVKFSEQVRTFIALFGQLEDLTDKPVWPGYTRGLVRSLYLLGGTTQPAGIRVRPQFFQQQQVVTLMKSYLQQQNGCAFIQFPQLNFDGPLISRQTLVLELAGTYRQGSLRYNRATKDVRRSRKDPMVGSLTFVIPWSRNCVLTRAPWHRVISLPFYFSFISLRTLALTSLSSRVGPQAKGKGQIIATSHDLTPKDGLVREIPLFQGNQGWWNILFWPDICNIRAKGEPPLTTPFRRVT